MLHSRASAVYGLEVAAARIRVNLVRTSRFRAYYGATGLPKDFLDWTGVSPVRVR